MKKISSFHVGVAAEAFAAANFARCEYDVLVQYGANQPEYDIVVSNQNKTLKISVKGSQDGGWGLTQKYKKGNTYHQAIDAWLNAHHKGTIFCLVQFQNTKIDEMPRIYLAHPEEIAKQLKQSANGRGETILYENHTWGPTAAAYGTIDKIPDEWKFTTERVDEMISLYGL